MSQVNEIELVTSIWNGLKYFIHDRDDKAEAATQLIEMLFDLNLTRDDIEAIADEDGHLRAAYAEYCEIESGEESDDYDDESLDLDDYEDDSDDEWR